MLRRKFAQTLNRVLARRRKVFASINRPCQSRTRKLLVVASIYDWKGCACRYLTRYREQRLNVKCIVLVTFYERLFSNPLAHVAVFPGVGSVWREVPRRQHHMGLNVKVTNEVGELTSRQESETWKGNEMNSFTTAFHLVDVPFYAIFSVSSPEMKADALMVSDATHPAGLWSGRE